MCRHHRNRAAQHVLGAHDGWAANTDFRDVARIKRKIFRYIPESIDGGMKQPAARIRFHADAMNLEQRVIRLRKFFEVRVLAKQAAQAVTAVKRARWAGDAEGREFCCENAVMRAVTTMQSLDRGAERIFGKLHRATGHRKH